MFHLSKELEGHGYPLKLHHYLQELVHWVADKHQVIGDHPDLVPISNVSTAWKAADPWGNLRLPRAASTGSDMPPPPRPPAGSRCYSRYRSLSEAQRDRSRSSPCLPPPPAPPAPGSSAVTFDPHRRGVSSVPSRGRAISVPPSPPSTAPGSPASTAAPERKFPYAPWNDPQNDDRVPVTPPSPPSTAPVTPTASPATLAPWHSLKRRRTDGSVRTARTMSSQPPPRFVFLSYGAKQA